MESPKPPCARGDALQCPARTRGPSAPLWTRRFRIALEEQEFWAAAWTEEPHRQSLQGETRSHATGTRGFPQGFHRWAGSLDPRHSALPRAAGAFSIVRTPRSDRERPDAAPTPTSG